MSDFHRLIYIVQELERLLDNSDKNVHRASIIILKDDIKKHLNHINASLEINTIYKSEAYGKLGNYKNKI